MIKKNLFNRNSYEKSEKKILSEISGRYCFSFQILCRILIFVIFLIPKPAYTQTNSFFINLQNKEIATFNDAISLIRLVFDENDHNDNFLFNILWAAEKKLFKVTIPIQQDSVNPVISRKEFAYWLCRISEIGGKNIPATRRDAYKRAVNTGILYPGRGPEDSFTGIELLDTFSYYDYYIRSNDIQLRFTNLPLYEDDYDGIPEWRAKLYSELEEQRAYEKKIRQERREQRRKRIKKTDEKQPDNEVINIKIVE